MNIYRDDGFDGLGYGEGDLRVGVASVRIVGGRWPALGLALPPRYRAHSRFIGYADVRSPPREIMLRQVVLPTPAVPCFIDKPMASWNAISRSFQQ